MKTNLATIRRQVITSLTLRCNKSRKTLKLYLGQEDMFTMCNVLSKNVINDTPIQGGQHNNKKTGGDKKVN
jgi:hypothetical protein